MLNNEMRPYESDADHRRQTCDALSVSRVCVLYVEARRFYGAEGRFNLPTLFVARDSIFRPVETDQNLKLGHPLDSTSGRINILPFMQNGFVRTPSTSAVCAINILPFMQNGFVVELLLSDFEGIKEPPCPDSFSCGGLDNPNVLPDTDVVSNSVVVEPSNPLLADKLAVGHKTVDAAMSKKSDESLHYSLAFLPIGISALAQQAEQQWNGNVLVGDAEGEYIDVELSELPVGSVHTQNPTVLNRKPREDHPCCQVEVQGIVGDEPLNAAQIGIALNRRRHRRNQFVKAHSLHPTKCMEHISHKLYAGKIHRNSKILLHNRADLANFNQILGISNLHRESSELFFKVTES